VPEWFGLAHSALVSERPRPKLIERLEARRAEHRNRHPAYRAAFAVAGSLVLLAGIVMLVTPGPAFVLIPAGLAMLALEFAWAERALDRALKQAQIAQEKAANTSTAQRVAGTVAGAALIAAAVFAAFYFNLGPL
jgi:uncharacterized protein (TIGR02611 family)